MKMMGIGKIEKVLTIIGNKRGISDAIALLITSVISACLLELGAMVKYPADLHAPLIIGAGIPMWSLISGVLDVLAVGFTTDKGRLENAGERFLVGAAKALAGLILLIGVVVCLWMR